MDPSRDDFNGSGLPPHGRHLQDQGQPQQIPGFPFQFQNNPLMALNSIERNRELRELQDRILIRQELERQQRALSEQQDFINQFRDRDSGLHHLQAGRNPLFFSVEDHLRFERSKSEHEQQRQNAQAVVERALLQQQQDFRQQRELLQQRELREMNTRQFQDLLLSRKNGDMLLQKNASDHDGNEEPQTKKRKLSISNSSMNETKTVINKVSRPKGNRGRKKKNKKSEVNTPKSKHDKCWKNGAVKKLRPGKLNVDDEQEAANDHLDLKDQQADIIDISSQTEYNVDTGDMDVIENETSVSSDYGVIKIDEDKDSEEIRHDISFDVLIRAANQTELNDDIEEVDNTVSKPNPSNSILEIVTPDPKHQPKLIFTDEEAVDLINDLKVIIEKDVTAAAYFGIPVVEPIEISPGHFTNMPTLPEEPEYDEVKAKEKLNKETDEDQHEQELQPSNGETDIPLDVTEPTLLDCLKKDTKMICDSQNADNWFPCSMNIRKERRAQGLNDEKEITLGNMEPESIQISEEMNKRLRYDVEPGVLEKLPHCRLYYDLHMKQYGKPPKDPLFCCQVTETFCKSTMLCCSICSTWRHVECGGHYKHYSPNRCEEFFTPICNRCYEEEPVLRHYPLAAERLSRQRSIQLRTVNAVTAIMRNAACSKHGGTYKWPLGSVSHFHFGSHAKSIHLRHERAEKQWKEMAAKLNGTTSSKSNKSKARTRDFERLMVNLEDGEGQTDRHNMTLFLQWDTQRDQPAGFEKQCLNFFDPAEDDNNDQHFLFDDDDVEDDQKNKENGCKERSNDNHSAINLQLLTTRSAISPVAHDSPLPRSSNEGRGRIVARSTKTRHSPKRNKFQCVRKGCKKKPRFDSAFCSDGCGLQTLEKDLLYSLEYSRDMHPYELRP